jgi:hypothetical protein
LLHVLSQTLVQKRKPVSQSTGVSRGGSLLRGRAPCHLRINELCFLYSRLFRKPTTSSHSQGSKSCQHAKTLDYWGGRCGGKASHAQGHPQQHIYSENTFILHVPLSVNGRVPRQAVTCHAELFDILIDRRVRHTLVPSTTAAPKSHSETTYVCIKTFFHPYGAAQDMAIFGASALSQIRRTAPNGWKLSNM